MNIIFQKDSYSRIINEEEDFEFPRNKKIIPKKQKLKTKIIYKYCINKLSLLKCFLILLILFFIFCYLFQSLIILIKNYKIILLSPNIQEQNTNNKNLQTQEKTPILNKEHNKTQNKEQNETQNYTVIQNKEQNKAQTKIQSEKQENENNKIEIEEKFYSLRLSFDKALDFLKDSMADKLIQNKTKFKDVENPKISVVIPIYNCEKFIYRAIRSIQNQNILELEIVLVNDHSPDNTLSILEKYQKEDPRIKIINNKKNMGTLYSRSIGTLSSKGKYIFPLDNDDMFLDKDVFKVITNIADYKNIDIVEFRGISIPSSNNILKGRISETAFSTHELDVVMKQPQLSDYPLSAGKKTGELIFTDVYLWRKCIKSEMYKKVLNIIGEEKYSRYMIGHEDVVINFALFNTIKTFLYIGKYGILRIYRKDSANHQTKAINQEIKQIYLADIAFDFLKNTKQSQKLIYYLMFNILNLKLLNTILNTAEYYKKLLNTCFDRFFNCSFIPNEYKNEIRKKAKNLKFINYNF